MSNPRTINPAELVNDIRSGMNDVQLMEKHKVSPRSLAALLKQLVELKALRPREVYGRLPAYADDVILSNVEATLESLRRLPRQYVDITVGIHDAGDPAASGRLCDLTEEGLGVKGMVCTVGEVKTLLVTPYERSEFEPFLLKAECRWYRSMVGEDDAAGFKITDMSTDSLSQLRKLLAAVST
jgi:hypothetical protein